MRLLRYARKYVHLRAVSEAVSSIEAHPMLANTVGYNPLMLWWGGVLLSVLVTFLSFPPFPLGILMLVGMTPLFLALETAKSTRQAFFRAWLYVLIGNSAICFWVAHTMHQFAGLPWILSYPCVALLSVFEQSAWPLWAGIRHWSRDKLGKLPLFWSPCLLMFLDYLWPKFFPNTLGNAFYTIPWLSQAADLFGVVGLTGLIVLTNEALALSILKRPGWKREALSAGIAFVSIGAYGVARLHQVRRISPKESVKIAVVQPNINPVAAVREASDKHQARLDMLQPLLRLSREIVKEKPDLLFWPETSVSNTFRSQDENETLTVTQGIEAFQKETQIPLLFGARDRQQENLYNTLFLLDGPSLQRYYKHKLLWLGESIPLVSWIPALASTLKKQGATNFSPGPGPLVFTWKGFTLRPLICLEGLYSDYVNASPADLIVSATNDAWFGTGQEPALHLYLTAFRAIENRTPILRSTTTGYSALIGLDGQMIWRSELGEEVAKTLEVPLYPKIFSLYRYWGALPVWFSLAWVLWPFLRKRNLRGTLNFLSRTPP